MWFSKAHGSGNDFVVLDDWDDHLELSPELVRAVCDRRHGLGADGVLRLVRGSGDAHVRMDYRNADGSPVEMCGNGIRVVAKYAVDHGLVQPRADCTVVVDTPVGPRPAVVAFDNSGRVHEVTVDMGPPMWEPAAVPFAVDGDDALEVPLELDGGTVTVTALSMGNPHAVLTVDDVEQAPVGTLGPRLESDDRFPQRTNVEFAEVVAVDALRLRVWERGVGETAACGSGVCAAAAALHRLGRLGDRVTVTVPGGTLEVRYRPDEHPSVFLTGPAVEVARGSFDPAWLDAVRGSATTSPVPSR